MHNKYQWCFFNTQYFESDNPELYTTKVQYITENDVTDLDLVFAEEEYLPAGGSVVRGETEGETDR